MSQIILLVENLNRLSDEQLKADVSEKLELLLDDRSKLALVVITGAPDLDLARFPQIESRALNDAVTRLIKERR